MNFRMNQPLITLAALLLAPLAALHAAGKETMVKSSGNAAVRTPPSQGGSEKIDKHDAISARPLPPGLAPDRYLEAARHFADARLVYGIDNYGSEKRFLKSIGKGQL